MAEAGFPNRKLVDFLYDSYYAQDRHDQDRFVSSFWKYHSGKFDVQKDAEGNIVSLVGTGFGSMKTGSMPAKFLAYMGHLSYLLVLPHRAGLLKLIAPALKVCRSAGFYFSFDCFKQICSLELISRNMSDNMKKKRLNVLIIGDGYGFLASLVKHVFKSSTVFLVDIGRSLLFQAFYCQKAHPLLTHALAGAERDRDAIDFLYCPVEHLEELNGFNYDIAINIASMQEMNTWTVERYFSYLRKYCNEDNLFYCCNRELKTLPAGEVSEFLKYPWSDDDLPLVDGYCPWHRYFLSHRAAKNGPRILGVRVPFVNYFDGPTRHRLTKLFVSKP